MSSLRRSAVVFVAALTLSACGGAAPTGDAVGGAGAAPANPAGRDQLSPRSDRPTSAPPSVRPTPERATAPATRAPANDASRLRTLPASTTQVIVVQADGWGTSVGTLRAFEKRAGHWTPAFATMPARLGSRGFTDTMAEGTPATPTGVYGIGGTMYGIAPNPGVRYAYHRLVENDWWNENADTPGYNTFVHGADPGGPSEALWETDPQYRYFAVINYNIPVREADPPRGSAIFLHVMIPGRPTAGCVAIAESDLVKVLRWLNPAAKPRIVLAPTAELDRY